MLRSCLDANFNSSTDFYGNINSFIYRITISLHTTFHDVK